MLKESSLMKQNIHPDERPLHIPQDPIEVGGLTPLTTIDYPGELAAVIFMQGCPWRCRYCQNGGLLDRKTSHPLPWQEVIEFLSTRQGLLDAVVFSGGEPTLQKGLIRAIKQVKKMGFKIGLHTAGIYPERLSELLPLIDWVGLDIKAPDKDYQSITGVKGSGIRAWQSAQIVIQSNVPHEFRTTLHPDIINNEQIDRLIHDLKKLGAENFALQSCLTENCLDASLSSKSHQLFHTVHHHKYHTLFNNFTIRKN